MQSANSNSASHQKLEQQAEPTRRAAATAARAKIAANLGRKAQDSSMMHLA